MDETASDATEFAHPIDLVDRLLVTHLEAVLWDIAARWIPLRRVRARADTTHDQYIGARFVVAAALNSPGRWPC